MSREENGLNIQLVDDSSTASSNSTGRVSASGSATSGSTVSDSTERRHQNLMDRWLENRENREDPGNNLRLFTLALFALWIAIITITMEMVVPVDLRNNTSQSPIWIVFYFSLLCRTIYHVLLTNTLEKDLAWQLLIFLTHTHLLTVRQIDENTAFFNFITPEVIQHFLFYFVIVPQQWAFYMTILRQSVKSLNNVLIYKFNVEDLFERFRKYNIPIIIHGILYFVVDIIASFYIRSDNPVRFAAMLNQLFIGLAYLPAWWYIAKHILYVGQADGPTINRSKVVWDGMGRHGRLETYAITVTIIILTPIAKFLYVYLYLSWIL